ncbi:hypothetical protein [Oceanobacillus sp. CF4.6]|uniref:hypothetical protein n=1 Tax=Oceanobacillus sp. CF4.6 TaxID=3373080 RepID=UPI003EE6E498
MKEAVPNGDMIPFGTASFFLFIGIYFSGYFIVAKYSNDLMIKVAKEYQHGYLGIRQIAKKQGIKSKS